MNKLTEYFLNIKSNKVHGNFTIRKGEVGGLIFKDLKIKHQMVGAIGVPFLTHFNTHCHIPMSTYVSNSTI